MANSVRNNASYLNRTSEKVCLIIVLQLYMDLAMTFLHCNSTWLLISYCSLLRTQMPHHRQGQ